MIMCSRTLQIKMVHYLGFDRMILNLLMMRNRFQKAIIVEMNVLIVHRASHTLKNEAKPANLWAEMALFGTTLHTPNLPTPSNIAGKSLLHTLISPAATC